MVEAERRGDIYRGWAEERERDEDLERKMRKYEMDKQLKELTASATVERKEGLLRFEKMENENWSRSY